MAKKVCFSFWLDKNDAVALRVRLIEASKKNGRRVGVGEIVWPAVKRFIKK